MVRLKVGDKIMLANANPFQFLYGAIKSKHSDKLVEALFRFQFLYGAIKRLVVSKKEEFKR